MTERKSSQTGAMTREERLAAQLRANLHRRKAQARAMSEAGGAAGDDHAGPAPAARESEPKSGLSKSGDGR